MKRRRGWEALLHIDRRFIYAVLFIVVLLTLVFQWKSPAGYTNRWTQQLYDYIDKLPPGTPVMLAFDFDPSSRPEVYPMAMALTRHVLSRDLRLITVTLLPAGQLLAEQVTDQVALEQGKQYGVDYVNLGFNPNSTAVLLGMGENLQRVYTLDTRHKSTLAIPALRGVHSYADIKLVVDITGTSVTGDWIVLAHQRYKVPLAAAVTSVVAVDLYPYLMTGQLVGMINGIAGAAEYEQLIKKPDQGQLAMAGVTAVHLLMVLLVVIGNIAYFVTRRHAGEPEAEPPEPPTGEEV